MVKIVDDKSALDANAITVCQLWSRPGIYDDDVKGYCCDCGEALRHRPHVPEGARLICMECLLMRDPESVSEIVITRSTLKDVSQ